MTYLAPVITSSGITAPTYAEIFASLQASFQSIFGSDIYIEPDSQDGQMIATFATAIKNNNDAIIAAYNAFSPSTAKDIGLSSVVKINGIRRLVPTNSQVTQRITGTVGTIIQNGQVADPNTPNILWALPALVTIPIAGYIDVTATAVEPGTTLASTGTLTQIVNPQRGWQSTTNTNSATPGDPVESDAALRQRQSASTALPALSVLDAILGAIKNIPGVGRAFIYENDTNVTDSNNIPPHSISAVVEGGDIQTIGETIALYKTPGTGTYGDEAVDVIDPKDIPITIHFYELTLIDIGVIVVAAAATNYVSTTADLIKESVAEWMNLLFIGQDSFLNKLWSPVNLSGDAATTATGQTQTALDLLSSTYNATAIYQARLDNMVLTAPTTAGNNTFAVANSDNYSIGQAIAIILNDGTRYTSIITNKVGLTITALDNIPGGKTASAAAAMYVAGNVAVDFNEAASGQVADILVSVV